MIIARERYLDDTSEYHITISLATRTGPMHSLLSNVPEAEREAINEILVRAANEIEGKLKPFVNRERGGK
jgi:hypothetical protein